MLHEPYLALVMEKLPPDLKVRVYNTRINVAERSWNACTTLLSNETDFAVMSSGALSSVLYSSLCYSRVT